MAASHQSPLHDRGTTPKMHDATQIKRTLTHLKQINHQKPYPTLHLGGCDAERESIQAASFTPPPLHGRCTPHTIRRGSLGIGTKGDISNDGDKTNEKNIMTSNQSTNPNSRPIHSK